MKSILGFISGILNFISGIFLFYLFFSFLKWYVKGHFGKYFILFWAYTILTIYFWSYKKDQYKKEQDPRSGYEIWNENMDNYDPARGY